jgi:hypothetical protein
MGQGDVPVKNREARRLGGRAHQRRRIWPGELAGAMEFGEGFRDGLAMNLRRGKGRRGWISGAI